MSTEPDSAARAKQQLKRAAQLYKSGDKTGAVKALGAALELDMSLRYEADVQKFAAKITGLSPEAAVEKLSSFHQRTALVASKRKSGQSGGGMSGTTLVIMAVAGLVVVVVGVFLVFSEVLPRLMPNAFVAAGQVERRTVAGYPDIEYHVALPHGPVPELGWPTLVALHDVGQGGPTLLEALRGATQANGILLVAPTFANMPFGQYRDDGSDFYAEARNTLLLVLSDIETRAFEIPVGTMHFLGQVYFGYGEGAIFLSWLSQAGLDYPDAGFAINMPLAAVLATNTPELLLPTYVPYLIMDSSFSPDSLSQTVQAVQEAYTP